VPTSLTGSLAAWIATFGGVATAGYTIPVRRVQAFVGLALHRGWDIEAMLHQVGISPMLLTEQRSRVTTTQVKKLVQLLWSATDDELMGLGSAPVPRGTFRLLSFALLTSDDVGTALQRTQQFSRALPGVPDMHVSPTADGHIRIAVDLSGVGRPLDLLVDALLATAHRYLGWAIGRRVPVVRVEVPYPDNSDVDDYDLIFGAPIVFDAPDPALVLRTAILDAPLVRSEAELEEFVRDAPADILARRDYGTSVADQIRRMIKFGRHEQLLTMDDVAARLAMSPQTVRRKLRGENTSLREIREEVLRDAAIASLAKGDETIAALSERLGFSEPSAFTRAFRRWTGSAPSSYRPQ
jgi:AraC-like DNA-binding protein